MNSPTLYSISLLLLPLLAAIRLPGCAEDYINDCEKKLGYPVGTSKQANCVTPDVALCALEKAGYEGGCRGLPDYHKQYYCQHSLCFRATPRTNAGIIDNNGSSSSGSSAVIRAIASDYESTKLALEADLERGLRNGEKIELISEILKNYPLPAPPENEDRTPEQE